MLINAGAWTHYSYGIRDALAILTCPIVEIHISNTHARDLVVHGADAARASIAVQVEPASWPPLKWQW